MRIGILGSGVVGQTLGLGLINQGYDVKIGTRDPSKLNDWKVEVKSINPADFEPQGNYVNIYRFLEELSKHHQGYPVAGTENAIKMAKKDNLKGKIIVDVTNPLDFSKGGPGLATKYPESAAEHVKKWTDAKVVKAFNIIPAHIMVNPRMLGEADLFIAGDEEGKEFVKKIAKNWGWNDIIDMGDIKASWWVEMLGMTVINYGVKYNDWNFAVKFLRK